MQRIYILNHKSQIKRVLKDKKLIKYFVQFLISVLLLQLSFLAEQRFLKNTPQQQQDTYKRLQETIRNKELSLVKTFQKLLKDTANYEKNWLNINEIAKQENCYIQIFKNDTLFTWTSNLINGQKFRNKFKDGISFIINNNGSYLAYSKISGSFQFIIFYNIYEGYNYKNQYLNNKFNDELAFLDNGIISPQPLKGFSDIKDISDKYLFSVEIFSKNYLDNFWLILLSIFAIAYFCIRLHLLCNHLLYLNIAFGTFYFFLVMFLLKKILLLYQLPSYLYKLKLFSPIIYATNDFVPSLGDFLVVAFIAVWFVILIDSKRILSIQENNIYIKYTKLFFYVLITIISIDSGIDSIKSLIFDSQISFSLKNVYLLSQFSFYGLFIAVILIGIIHICVKNCYLYISKNKFNKWVLATIILSIYLIIHPLIINYIFDRKHIYFLGSSCLILVFVAFNYFVSKANRFQHYFILVILISFATSYSIYYFSNLKDIENRQLYASKLISQNDINTEYFLRDIEKKILVDKQIKYYFLNEMASKSQFKKSMQQLYFTGYLSKYEVIIYDYDSIGNHLNERNNISFHQLNEIYKNQSIETIDKYFKYLKTSSFLKGYLSRFLVKNGRVNLGYVFIQLQPKLIQDENRFEELQLEGTSNTIGFKKFDYSYAIYKNKALISQSGNYPYRTINSKTTEQEIFTNYIENDFEHLEYKNDNQLTVIVSKKHEAFYEPLGLFSLVFTFFTLILIFSLTLYTLVNSRFLKEFKLLRSRTYRFLKHYINRFLFIKDPDVVLIRTRIQVSIILIVFITLSITAYVTISFIQSEYNSKQNEKLSRKIRSVVNTLQGEASDYIIKNKQSETKAYINQLADFYDTDISIYNLNGRLVASSISKVFDEGVISDLINPTAFYHLSKLKESQFSQSEQIADFSYLAAYVPIYKNENDLIGYAQLPYFSKRADLLSEISSIVVGFINLYALLFIIIGIIAYIISRNISYPLILIQRQLSTTNLGKKNEPILWNRKDEIGDLVKQYNLMIDKLEESANKLAQSEREGAWRDIARQIAHEIKNPLTPMKLSVQHLQRAWNDKHPKLEETFHKVSKTIITQIDVLNDLASEFSNYAKMPTPEFNNINLLEAIQPVIDLNQNDENIKIINQITAEIYVYFDQNYLNRTFVNLIKNAIQSIPEDTKGLIDISAIIENDFVKINISDNGKGISKSDAAKIFTPYFSTKIHGMGLGLPMVNNMIQAAGGKISFTSNENIGTIFEVILPIGKDE